MKALLLLLSLSATSLIAQNGFTTYTTNLSLGGASKTETALLVDNSNQKWIGFMSNGPSATPGLLKYDNVTWTMYNTSSTPALPSNTITALAQDQIIGHIWIGTNMGLVRYDGTNFTTYNTSNGLPSNTITCIEPVGTQIYIGTNAGLSRFDGTNFTNYNTTNGLLPYNGITCLKAENPNLIWIGGNNTITEFNINSSFTTTNYQLHNIPNSLPNSGNINCIYVDGSNKKWLGTTVNGLLIYDGLNFTNANSVYDIYGGAISNKIMDIAEGFNNGIVVKFNYYYSNYSSGLIELCPNQKVYQYFYSKPINELGMYIEKHANELIISDGYNTIPKAYHTFNVSNYTLPIGTVNNNNMNSLDINNVKAGITNSGDMHWGIGGSQTIMYEVPKGSNASPNFATALWIGGLDAGNQLHGAAQTYRQGGVDYWPGPLDTTNASIDTTTAIQYDKIWKVSYSDINNFITAYSAGSVIATPDMLSWPAHGNGNNSRNLAPFVDYNGDGIYNPNDGDYPKIKGDQALYYIFNDNLASHSTSFTPMGVEIQGMAYAYGCPSTLSNYNALDFTTFYDYKIINRSANNYHNVYVSMWSDVDVGYYDDDYIGSNVSDNYAYAYNGDNIDDNIGSGFGYGTFPPAQGFNILKGPRAPLNDGIDNNNNGLIDETDEDCKLNVVTYNINAYGTPPPQMLDPIYNKEYYQYMSGFWKDSTHFTCGGNGYGGTINSNWMYPGDPANSGVNTDPTNTCGYWIENGTPGDRRLILSAGPFNLNAGQMQEIEYAFVTSFDSSATASNILVLNKLKSDIQQINTFYNLTSKPICTSTVSIGVNELSLNTQFNLFPNPTTERLNLQITSLTDTQNSMKVSIYNVIGKEVMNPQEIKTKNGSMSASIDVSSLSNGVYFIKVGNSTKKFIKE
ncbi:MAG: T9SS type A sorting domain-containing protein [Bacteroidia bacterium]|nr:T9SS type A sorting domain-containing protein [Bacteroidia bacterium]